MAGVYGTKLLSKQIINRAQDLKLRDKSFEQSPSKGLDGGSQNKESFVDLLKNGINEVDQMQKQADKMAVEVATGKTGNIHETMLAVSQAELAFNMMVQVRNKALEAYQEIMRMPV